MPEDIKRSYQRLAPSFIWWLTSFHSLLKVSSSWRVHFHPCSLSQCRLWPLGFRVSCVQGGQNPWPPSFCAKFSRMVAGGVLMISFTLHHHTRPPGEEKEGCFICSSVTISGLGREQGLVKWKRKGFLICIWLPQTLSNLFLFKTKSKTCFLKPF